MNIIFVLFVVLVVTIVNGAPIDRQKSSLRALKNSVDYGPAFDEVTVNSSLNIRRKNQTRVARQTTSKRNHNKNLQGPSQLPPGFPSFPSFPGSFSGGAAAGTSQAQAFNSVGPVANFGAAATGAQTQSFNVGPGGLSGSAGLSGSQQYNLNGMTIDVAFGEAFSAAANGGSKSDANGNAVSIVVTGKDGKKRPIGA